MKSKGISIQSVCEFLFHVEKKYNLLDREFLGGPVWQYSRVPLYMNLQRKLGVGDAPHSQIRKSIFSTFVSLFRAIFIKNPFFVFSRCDKLFLEHSRLQEINAPEYIDIYSYFIEQEWSKKGENWRALSLRSPDGRSKQKRFNRYYVSSFGLIYRIAKLLPSKISGNDRKLIGQLESEIQATFGIYVKIEDELIDYSIRLKVNRMIFEWLLKIWKVKEIYIVVGYDLTWAAAILAAKKYGIRVTEVQHGNFSRYHLGYSFPDRDKKLPYFPDRFLVWNEFWKSMIPFHKSIACCEIRQFDWLEYKKANYTHTRKTSSIIVLSQGLLGDRVAQELSKYIDRWSGRKIYYKLHPGEYSRWKDYKCLGQLIDEYDVEVLEACDLYRKMSECEIQVGVYSTAIYEGIEFGCKTYLLELPGIENMQDLIGSGKAELLHSND